MCAIRSWTSGSCFSSHSSFGAVKPVSARLPVAAISASSPIRSSISSHSAPVRWSFHRIAGRSTCSSASSATSPCICPDRPMPATSSAPSALERLLRRRHHSSGSCSAQPGFGVDSPYSTSARPTTSPSSETASAFSPRRADVEPDRDAHAAGAPSAA